MTLHRPERVGSERERAPPPQKKLPFLERKRGDGARCIADSPYLFISLITSYMEKIFSYST